MKKLLFLGLMLTLLLCSGCAVDRGVLKQEVKMPNGEVYTSQDDNGRVGFGFTGDYGPDRLARRLDTVGNLKVKEAYAESIKNRKFAFETEKAAGGSGVKSVALRNFDTEDAWYFHHPEVVGERCIAQRAERNGTEGFTFCDMSVIPDEIVVHSLRKGEYVRHRIDKQKLKTPKWRNGVRIDYEMVVNARK